MNWNTTLYTTHEVEIVELIPGYISALSQIPLVSKLANTVIYTFAYNESTAQFVADVQNNRPALDVDGNMAFAPEAIYDIVILPFNPNVQGEVVGTIVDEEANVYNIRTVFSSYGNRTYDIDIREQDKVDSIAVSYEITSSDYTSRMILPVFENKGFDKFDIRWQLLPNQTRYHILPHYKEYNGGQFEDDRGMWCEAIPMGLISDA